MLLAILAEDNPFNRHHKIGPSIHTFLLVRKKEEGPHVNPINSYVNNLQERNKSIVIENNIISIIPNCPIRGTNSHIYMSFFYLINPFNQLSNIFGILVGGIIWKVKWITLQTRRTRGREINKCSGFAESQKTHFYTQSILFLQGYL
jgi:hypothetical protein